MTNKNLEDHWVLDVGSKQVTKRPLSLSVSGLRSVDNMTYVKLG